MMGTRGRYGVFTPSLRTDLHREELTDERHERRLLAVPHLLAVELYSAPELPPLPAELHEDLKKRVTQTSQTRRLTPFHARPLPSAAQCEMFRGLRVIRVVQIVGLAIPTRRAGRLPTYLTWFPESI